MGARDARPSIFKLGHTFLGDLGRVATLLAPFGHHLAAELSI